MTASQEQLQQTALDLFEPPDDGQPMQYTNATLPQGYVLDSPGASTAPAAPAAPAPISAPANANDNAVPAGYVLDPTPAPSLEETQKQIDAMPPTQRMLVNAAAHPENLSLGGALKAGAGAVWDQMKGGASDLADLITGDSDSDLQKAKDEFNQKYQDGTATSSDVKKLYLAGFSDNPGGKALGAARLFPPIAMGSALLSNVVNPAAEATVQHFGGDPEDVQLAEIPAMMAGAKAPKAEMSMETPVGDPLKATADAVNNAAGAVKDKAQVAAANLTDTESPDIKDAPDSMKTDNRGNPLIINNGSIADGIKEATARAQADGYDFNDVADHLEQLKKVDPKATALDAIADMDKTTGANTFGLAQSIAQTTGQGRTLMRDMTSRGEQAGGEIRGVLNDSLNGSDYTKTLQAARQNQQDGGKMYERAYAQPNPQSPALTDALNLAPVKNGLARGLELEKNDAYAQQRQFNPADYSITGTDEKGNPTITPNPSMRMWATAKRGLDAMIGDEFDPIKGKYSPEGVSLIGVKNRLTGELGRLNPMWRQANETFSSNESVQNSGRLGQTIDKMRPEDVQRFMSNPKTPAADKEAFTQGAGENWDYKLGERRETTNPIESLMDSNFKARLRAMLPNDAAYNSTLAKLNLHKTQARVNKIAGGSPTVSNAAFTKEAIPHTLPARIVSEIPLVGGLAGYGIDKALAKRTKNMTEDSRTVVGRILSTSDPEVLRYVAKKGAKK